MTKRLKKFTAMILAGLLACFSLTACSDEVEVKPDEPMGPSEILNALKNASDYTVTLTDGDDYNITVKKDGALVYEVQTGSASWGSNDLEIYYDYSGSATFKKYVLTNGIWETTEYNTSEGDNAFYSVKHALPVSNKNIDTLFNDAYYTSTGTGSYTMNAAGLTLIEEDAVTITSSGMIYTIKVDFWTVTINFNDTVLTLPTV
ncbi:MAG: hypothetical protein IJW62_02005 [Clostridia bacterium]|nr:hypothetical protein [Clostridia bacterium]